MSPTSGPPRVVRFGPFEADLAAGELRQGGRRISLQDQPFEVLRLLLERPGEVVSREEVRQKLWSGEDFGDFDQRLNVAIVKVRTALGDSAQSPRFVETLPRRGYRFIAPVENPPARAVRHRARAVTLAAVLLLLLAAGYLIWRLFLPTGPARDARIMLAVLPFENLSGDAEQEYFSDGLTEEMILQLSKVSPQRLGVVARTSVRGYKETQKTAKRIGQELGVSYVLEGSVRRQRGRVRISAQLVRTADHTQLWAEAYEGELANILALQQDVAQRVASSLAVKMLAPTRRATKAAPATNPMAYEAYLKGLYFRNRHTEDGFSRAMEAFEQTLEADPGYAPAYAAMASCSCLLSGHGMEIRPPGELMTQAQHWALQALELDGSLAEAHAVLGMAYLKYDWDFAAAEGSFQRAIELNPSYAQAHLWYSLFLEAMGRQEEAVARARIGRDLDPLSLEANVNLGLQLLQAGRHDEAAEQIDQALELDPSFWGAHWALGNYHLRTGMHDQAVEELGKAVELSGANTVSIAFLGYASAMAGRRAGALEALRKLRILGEQRYVSPAFVAVVYAGLGEVDEAFTWLEKAYDQRSRYLVWLKVAPEFQGLRSDPRYDELTARIGLPG